MLKLHSATRLDLVWDRYVKESMHGRNGSRKAWKRNLQVNSSRGCHFEKLAGLQVDSNKLFNFSTKALFVTFYQDGKQLVISDSDSISSKPPLCDLRSLPRCTHEADICLILHANRAALCAHCKVLNRTVDTDVILGVCCRTTGSRLYTLGSIWNRQKFPLLGCPQNGYCTGNEKGPGTFHVSCFH